MFRNIHQRVMLESLHKVIELINFGRAKLDKCIHESEIKLKRIVENAKENLCTNNIVCDLENVSEKEIPLRANDTI